jgi:hypothetical protein
MDTGSGVPTPSTKAIGSIPRSFTAAAPAVPAVLRPDRPHWQDLPQPLATVELRPLRYLGLRITVLPTPAATATRALRHLAPDRAAGALPAAEVEVAVAASPAVAAVLALAVVAAVTLAVVAEARAAGTANPLQSKQKRPAR